MIIAAVHPETLQQPFDLQNVHGPRYAAFAASVFVAILALVPVAAAQSAHRPPAEQAKEPTASPAEMELRRRLDAAQAAQRSGDPAAAAQANQRLIALSLRELGQLRLLETSLSQAIELYKRSLDFEDVPDAHVDLAIAELQANHFDEALAQTDKAIAADPGNARAFGVRGRVWIKKQEYAKAAEALARSVQLDPAAENDVETLYSLGICYLQTKDPREQEKVSAVFERMVRAQGDSGSLHVLFGRAYRDADEMPSAIREFERAIALDTRTPHAHYFLGLARLAVNEWKATPAVRTQFAKELEYYPKDYLANYMTGFLASGDRNYDVSDRYLKIAAGLDPRAPEPPLYLGLNAYAQGDNKTAEEMFRKAIELTGKDEARSNFQIRRAYVDMGRILANSGRTEESEVYLGKARELQNKTMELTQQNVSAMALAGGAGSAAAIMPLSRQSEAEAAPLPPGSADPFARVDAAVMARSNLSPQQRVAADAQEKQLRSVLGLGFNDLATSEAVRKQYAAALGHYQEAEKWDASIEGLEKNLGVCAFRVENYPEAIRGLSLALQQNSADSPVRAMLGMAYFGAEHFTDAVKTFSPLGMRGQQDGAVGYAWAASLAHLGELKQASAVLSELEKTQLSSDTLLLVGQLWIELGDYTRATNALHLALQADPSLLKAHYFAGQAYLRAEQWAEASAEFQAELALDPADADAKFNLGFVNLQQSKTDEAKAVFEQVIAAEPRHSNAQYQLGKLLLDRGQVTEAIAHLEIAAQLSPQTDYIHYQLQAAYRKASRTEDADRELSIYKELKARQREKDAQRIPSP
ncbi:MAG TPA: tetratricopeptide repeat protein [Candidatus Acidoferrum sp.]|nr:tetratricopeptide repeat protein [Candidatus Acidoferrum sp.]